MKEEGWGTRDGGKGMEEEGWREVGRVTEEEGWTVSLQVLSCTVDMFKKTPFFMSVICHR